MKKRLILIAAVIGLLVSCGDLSGNNPGNKPVDPEKPIQNTYIVFDNTQGICAVSVYDDYRRRNDDKIADINAGRLSAEIEYIPGVSVPFYFSYRITIKGINDFSLNYVPEIGRDQKQVRIDADTTTNIKIPTLSETISSPDKTLSNNSYLIIRNNSSFSFQLLRGSSILSPGNASASLVNNGERVQYSINPGPASNYRLLAGADYKEFPGSIVSFEAGHIYIFDFNGSISLVMDTELKLINVNGIAIPQPPAVPAVIVSNRSLTLQWAAVESAIAYEIWMSTVNDFASATQYGTDITGSLTATISGLNNGTIYYIWLKAKNILGTSGFSPVVKGIPSASTVKPPDPQIAPSIIAGNGQLTVNWQAVEDASVYEVWAGTTNNTQTATKRGEEVSGLSTVITGLNNGTTYYVWIKARNNIGVSGFSPPATGKPLGTPGMPTISSGFEQLLVTWTAVAGAEQYEVFYGTDTPTTLAATTAGTMATITGLTAGTTYYVRLRAKNVSGVSDYGPSASGVPIGDIGVITVSSGDGQLSLSWAAVAGADQYELYHSITSIIPASPSQTVSTTTATINGLTNGTTYYVWVKGKNAIGTSNTSVAVYGKPLGTPGTPTVNPAYKGLLVTWSSVAGADEYEVYYGISTPTTLAITTTETTTIITELTAGMTYNVCLRAKNSNGMSDFGPTASGIPNTGRSPGLYRGTEKIGEQNLASALSWISTNAVSGDEFYIVLGANESISPKTLSCSGKTIGITLIGYSGERNITLNVNDGSIFTVTSGVTLTLDENITLVGLSKSIVNTASLVSVFSGNLIMNDGAKITGNYATTLSHGGGSDAVGGGGAGIYIGSNGDFTMNGGEISGNDCSGNYGGGVLVDDGIFTMNNGEIYSNTSAGGSGIYVYSSGTFIMNGGKISDNISLGSGGGIFVYGTFTMNGGEISDNIARMFGGGISVYGTFIMKGGKISGNKISSNTGGGVWVSSNGIFTKSSGGIITGYASDMMEGNVVKNISGVVQNNMGHAVYVYSSGMRRETTAGPEVNLDSSKNGKVGGWEN